MNYRQRYSLEREAREKIRVSNRNRDCLRWHSGESWNHILRKLEVCHYLKTLNLEFYTEAIFDNGEGRADICIINPPKVIEIVESETNESIEAKKLKYPDIFEVIFVSATGEFNKEELGL